MIATRTALVALVGTAAGCYAALPTPRPPFIHGAVTAGGGTLGDWRFAPSHAVPLARDLDGLDLVDPAAPGRVLRVVRPPADHHDRGRYVEHDTPRTVELRLADGATEVVLTPERCTRLDAIARAAHGVEFGSARFDCDLGELGQVRGDVEFAAGGYVPLSKFSGHLEATDSALAHVRFEPDQGQTDPRGVIVWDHRYPRVVFEIDAGPPDASVLGAASNATLRVRSTAATVDTFAVAPEQCHVLRLDRSQSGFVRVGANQRTLWSGTLDIDCETPGGGRLVGRVVLAD